jgi:hypothetical protein
LLFLCFIQNSIWGSAFSYPVFFTIGVKSLCKHLLHPPVFIL